MLLYLGVVIMCYFAVSGFTHTLFDTFDDLEDEASEAYYDVYMPWIRTSFNMFFGFLGAIPITWFIVYIFGREHDWKYRRFG